MAFQGDSIFWVEVEKVVPNPFQPRREFNADKLKELSESIRMYGILQPLTVTRKEIQREDGAFFTEYELIAGERRLRASRLAGLAQVPVIIREGENNEQEKLELAIIENLQREDLNAVDRGLAFKQLAETFKLSHAQVAKKVGRSREYVSNTMRILQLREYMLDSLRVGDITEGHARTLLMLNDRPAEQDTVYREILLKKLSVREVERIARKIAFDKVRNKKWLNTDPGLIAIEKQFTETLGTRVQIAKTNFGGKLTIDYFSDEDLNKLLQLVQQEKNEQSTDIDSRAHAEGVIVEELHNTAVEDSETIAQLAEHTPLEPVVDTVRDIASPEVPVVAIKSSETTEISSERAISREDPIIESSPATDHQYAEKSVVAEPSANSLPPTVSPIEETLPSTQNPTPITMPEIVQAHEPAKSATPTREQTFVTESQVKEKEEDDSDLYAIRNFEV